MPPGLFSQISGRWVRGSQWFDLLSMKRCQGPIHLVPYAPLQRVQRCSELGGFLLPKWKQPVLSGYCFNLHGWKVYETMPRSNPPCSIRAVATGTEVLRTRWIYTRVAVLEVWILLQSSRMKGLLYIAWPREHRVQKREKYRIANSSHPANRYDKLMG